MGLKQTSLPSIGKCYRLRKPALYFIIKIPFIVIRACRLKDLNLCFFSQVIG